MINHLIYILVCVLLALSINKDVLSASAGVFAAIGFIGLWRYSWALINFIRATLYINQSFPKLRKNAVVQFEQKEAIPQTFFLVTTYGIETDITSKVYRSIFAAAARSTTGATVVSSVVDQCDVRIIRTLFKTMSCDMSRVELIFDKIAGSGKRDALATSLRTIASFNPTEHDMVVFVDGDTCVPENLIEQILPFFSLNNVGALTTDELPNTQGDPAFQDWFNLRFAQRQMMMSSMGYGRRVLTLTGRMSAFRGDLASNPSFIQTVQTDFIDHWRLGRVNFLTGDDKSTWYWLLKNGYEMLYLPDVKVSAIETQPRQSFINSAFVLMTRWFGNMLRNNSRALKVPISKIGFFTWWSILDQRVSMWTTLTAPIGILLTTIFFEPMALVAYMSWVMFTRYIFCALITRFRKSWFPISYPFLLYFSQITGAAVKTFVFFRLDRQKWTRQNTSFTQKAGMGARLKSFSSTLSHLVALGWLTVGVAYLIHAV